VFALDGIIDVFDKFDGAGGDTRAAIARNSNEVEGVVDADGAGEVGKEDGSAFEDADEDDRLALVVFGDLGADFACAAGDLFFGDEDLHSCCWGKDGNAVLHKG
jgi:hypothetical protein